MEQHLEAIRAIELRLDTMPPGTTLPAACGTAMAPTVGRDGSSEAPPAVNTAMAELTTLALACEKTRVASFMFLVNLKNTPHGSSTLLDATLVYVTSDTAWGKTHTKAEWPVLFAGKAGGRLRGDEHHNLQNENLSSALLSVVKIMGSNQTEIGIDGGRVTSALSGIQV